MAGLLALGGSSLAVASLGTSGHGHADDDETPTRTAMTAAGPDEGEPAQDPEVTEVSADGHGHAPGEGH